MAHVEYSVPSGSSCLDSMWHLTGQARNASNKREVATVCGLSSDSYKPRQLGSLHIEGRGRSTSKPSVLGPDKTIGEIGG